VSETAAVRDPYARWCERGAPRGVSLLDFVCKPSSHPLIQEYLTGADPPVLEQMVKRGKQRFVHRYRWLRDVPLRDGRDALAVNWFEIEIISAKGETTYRNLAFRWRQPS
jgi:hypothetical protein